MAAAQASLCPCLRRWFPNFRFSLKGVTLQLWFCLRRAHNSCRTYVSDVSGTALTPIASTCFLNASAGQGFCESICDHFFRWTVECLDSPPFYLFTDKMVLHIDVLGASVVLQGFSVSLMADWLSSKIIVGVEMSIFQLCEQSAKPCSFSCCMTCSHILCFCLLIVRLSVGVCSSN